MHFNYDGGHVAVAARLRGDGEITYLSEPIVRSERTLTFIELWDDDVLLGYAEWPDPLMVGTRLAITFYADRRVGSGSLKNRMGPLDMAAARARQELR